MELDNKLKIFRMRNDITQNNLAEIIDISRQYINGIEAGKSDPSALIAYKIAKFFNASVEDIFFLKENIDQEVL